jgi:hypothetical protein
MFDIFFFENRAICEIMWKNIVEPDRPQMTIWRMRMESWVPKATNTHTHTHTRKTYCFTTATMVGRRRRKVTLYVQPVSCDVQIAQEPSLGGCGGAVVTVASY